MMEIIEEIKPVLQEKLIPQRNPDIAWFYCFFPALLAYFYLLTSHINEKPIVGKFVVGNAAAFNKLISVGTNVEEIATGMRWTEGPLWVDDESCSCSYLLFSDTLPNKILRWEDGKGLFTVGKTLYMENTGCRKGAVECEEKREPGSNGLLKFPNPPNAAASVNFLACQHGDRAISVIFENGTKVPIATHYGKSRFNSPNDLVWSPEGNLYFTDPPYGLYDNNGVLPKSFNNTSGVYMIRKQDILSALYSRTSAKKVKRLTTSLTRPNGIGFSPDFLKLYVSNSDKENPVIKVFDVSDDGLLSNEKTFFDASKLIEEGYSGVPDGFKIDLDGNLYASGPGGLLVISSSGELLGRLDLPSDRLVSNVGFGGDGRIYLTASGTVLRFPVRAKSAAIASPSKLFS